MAGVLKISRSSDGKQIKDKLDADQIGINHGEVTNNVTTLEEVFYISHDGVSPITNVKFYIDGLAEILSWADANAGDGLVIDTNNDDTFDINIKTGVGDTLGTAINLTDINPAEEKVIKVKIKVPAGESDVGIRNFNLKFNYDFTT
jgi:LEA14-like dessication related protein